MRTLDLSNIYNQSWQETTGKSFSFKLNILEISFMFHIVTKGTEKKLFAHNVVSMTIYKIFHLYFLQNAIHSISLVLKLCVTFLSRKIVKKI